MNKKRGETARVILFALSFASLVRAGVPCGDPAWGDCCVPNGTPGCDAQFCCETVCDADPFCCEVEWDQICADLVLGVCKGVCGDPPGFCGSGGDCCTANATPFCEDVECCDTVCAVDPFCCKTQWDQICADQAADVCGKCGAGCAGDLDDDGDTDSADLNTLLFDFGCMGTCVGDLDGDGDTDSADLRILLEGFGCVPPPSDCCAANATPGCDDRACEEVICAVNRFCCALEWDSLCAETAQTLCAVCGAPPLGACCFSNGGDCLNLGEATCVGLDGIWQGGGTACDTPGICDLP